VGGGIRSRDLVVVVVVVVVDCGECTVRGGWGRPLRAVSGWVRTPCPSNCYDIGKWGQRIQSVVLALWLPLCLSVDWCAVRAGRALAEPALCCSVLLLVLALEA